MRAILVIAGTLTRGAIALCAVLLACLWPAVALADLEAGVHAFEASDYEAAARELAPLAEKGDATAQYYLGRMYRYGWGVGKSDAEAVKWWRRAAEQGDWRSQKMLAFMLREGLGAPKDAAEAEKWERLASRGDPRPGPAPEAKPRGVAPAPVVDWPRDRSVSAAYCAGMYLRAFERCVMYSPLALRLELEYPPPGPEDHRAAEDAWRFLMYWSARSQELLGEAGPDMDLDFVTTFSRRLADRMSRGEALPKLDPQSPEWQRVEAKMTQFAWIATMGGDALQSRAKACLSRCPKKPIAQAAPCATACYQRALDSQEKRCRALDAPAPVTRADMEAYVLRLFPWPLLREAPK